MGNAILAAAPDGLAVVPLADFVDDGVDGLLLLDQARESTVLLAAVLEGGAPAPARSPHRSAVRPAVDPPAEGEWIRALHDASRLAAADAPRIEAPTYERASGQPTPCGEPVVLDAAPLSGGAVVHEAIRRRRSTRRFTAATIPLRDVGRILAHAFPPSLGGPDTPPTLPPWLLDTYVVAGAVEGLAPGIHRHDADHGTLVPARLGDPRQALFECCLQQELARDCAFAVLRTFDLPRAVERFGERAYRYAHLEAGLAGARLDLAALRLGHGSSGIGAFFDDLLVALLGLPHEHAVAYVTTIGVPFGGRRG
jgi:SagB-type dehydrogenase family enzyme